MHQSAMASIMSHQKKPAINARYLSIPFSIKRGQIRLDLPFLGKFKWGLIFRIEVLVHFVAVPDYTTYGNHSPSGKFWHDKFQQGNQRAARQLKLFVPMISKRREARIAKAKFEDMGPIAKKYPHWNRVDLEDMKYQFISYDLNHDGLIDFPELEKALDELGDTSSHETRRKCFDEVDVDGSDSIDFEEFIGLVETVSKQGGGSYLEDLFHKGQEHCQVGRWLSVKKMRDISIF